MNAIDIDGLLTQMRTLAAQSGFDAGSAAKAATAGSADFGAVLKQAISKVDQAQRSAMGASEAFTRGEPGVELPQVMVALQKADLSFRAMNEVRNRLVDAYRDVMNMQV